ncbi:MAG: thrombospondin type 3 repeat-containing protein, partial [Acidobacteriota bacterium]|nr:thrombospondin type 3 repeat-containing protein [Acidobacteriota bacterium]
QTWLDRIVTDDVGITSVTFGLRKDGIRYRSDRVSVRIAPGTPPFVPYRVVSASNWHRDHGFEQNTDIVVTEQIARLIADAEFGETGVRILGEPYLQWHNPNPWIEQTDPHRPVWRVAAQVQDAGSGVWNDWLIHIDAEDGSIESNTVTDETVGDRPGEEIRVYSVNLTREGNCWDDSPNRDLWFTTLGFTTEYANLPAGSDTFADGIDAWNGYHGTYHYFYDVFSRESMDGSGVLLETLVDVASRTGNADWNNASFNRNCNHMRFGDGWAVPDIIAHEFTHGVDRFSNQLIYANQSGALDESYADYFAAMVDGNWTIGEAREDGTRNPIRDMSNPPMRGDPDHRDPARSGDGTGLRPAVAVPAGGTGGNDWGAVHTNSGIPNKVGFLITDGGQHNGLTIAGLEQAKAERLQYMVFTTKLTSSSNFQHARDMTVEHAQTYVSGGHHDFTSLDVCDVINAWASVGYGDPDLDCNGVVDSPGGDADFDGIPNDRDNCPLARNIGQRDLDGDLTGDDCDPDVDGDLFFDTEDNCPRTANPNQADTDADGFGDLCDDDDGDGVLDLNDNCPLTPNEDQRDRDGDSQGDVCDNDADNDGLDNNVDNCPLDANASQYDPDSDGVGFQCDNCQFDPNPGQENLDGDGQGDVCDSDDDGDDFEDGSDNCPLYYNPRQIDNDGNGTGLYCDAGEKFQLTAFADLVELDIFVQNTDLTKPVVFPLYPCGQDTTCPNFLPEGFMMTVEVDTVPAYRARIVDDRGWGVTTALDDPSGSYTMQFEVDAEYFYGDNVQTPEFRGRKYFLELMPAAGASPGTLSGAIRVSAEVPAP